MAKTNTERSTLHRKRLAAKLARLAELEGGDYAELKAKTVVAVKTAALRNEETERRLAAVLGARCPNCQYVVASFAPAPERPEESA
jgi:hypothetical protein